ncbi:cupin domain-containing protein [Arenimonas fontis]|uniref:Cupin domain-containing protein n=1 Tax=Arenimonas fontis TaxID=2608255 RepID=A0A5B2ZFY7_9GAMM|nr:cupin domain-containing protein [Arenimonas fontis]KAA2286124.1 cupin domain-containing protein [Arenimonas fontis]
MKKLPVEVEGSARRPLGMPAARFLRDYWQKRPLLIRNAFPGFVSPITPEDLAGLACEQAVLSRIVVHHRRGDRWELRNGPFDEAVFPAMPQRDWTLLVQDVDKWDLDVRALLAYFRFLPAWRLDDIMVSFAAPGGSVGAHVDQYDVFLLQAQGRRRWQIDTRPDAPRGFRPDAELKLLRHFEPDHDWVLAPGDMLYLPPNLPHHGVAVDACLTFSVGMRAPSRAELLLDLAEALAAALPEEDRYADPDLEPPADPFEIDAAALARVRAALSGMAAPDGATLADWFGRFITRYRSGGEIPPSRRAPTFDRVLASLERGGRLLRHPQARYAWARTGRRARLFANGLGFDMGLRSARSLAAADELEAATVAALDAAAQKALASLVARGHYVLRPPPRRR